jgi:hypothetical protein
MQRLMDQMGKIPALIVGRRWDVLASNDALRAVYFDFESLPADERNLIWFHFTNLAARSLGNWEADTREVLARFRVDYGRHTGDSDFVELVERLKSVSPEFADWWPWQDVSPLSEGRAEFMHGTIFGDHITLSMAENPDLRLILIIPRFRFSKENRTANAHARLRSTRNLVSWLGGSCSVRCPPSGG